MAAYPLDDRGVVVTCTACGQRNRLLYERLGDQVQCGQCKRQLTGITAPIEIDSTVAFDRLIEKASVTPDNIFVWKIPITAGGTADGDDLKQGQPEISFGMRGDPWAPFRSVTR